MKSSATKSDRPSSDAAARGTGSSVRRWAVIGSGVLAVFVAAGLVGAVVRDHKAKVLAPPASAAGPSALAVPVYGKAPVTLTVFEDMRDPGSAAFARTYDPMLAQLVASGTVNVYYREVAGVDAAQGGSGSLRAGNALGCAQDAKLFSDYRDVLLQNQPAVSDDSYASDDRLISLARKVKGLDTDVFRGCVDGSDHTVWVKDSTKDFKAAQLGSAPVLQMQVTGQDQPQTLVGGGSSLTPQQITAQVIAAAQVAPVASPSPSPSA
ncbi:DsbA family protein [Streptacidiphilus sp. EB129]|uniref:DsbA family protein n=1 Tax=Streptacidiphilus sp. EB129 TaxID=3156262 RepID=UPI003515763B